MQLPPGEEEFLPDRAGTSGLLRLARGVSRRMLSPWTAWQQYRRFAAYERDLCWLLHAVVHAQECGPLHTAVPSQVRAAEQQAQSLLHALGIVHPAAALGLLSHGPRPSYGDLKRAAGDTQELIQAVDRLRRVTQAASDCFQGPQAGVPQTLHPNDGRLTALMQLFAPVMYQGSDRGAVEAGADGRAPGWLQTDKPAGLSTLPRLREDAIVADIGSGTGRYLEHLSGRFPKWKLLGLDRSAALLQKGPRQFAVAQASLLGLPLATGVCDAAICVEALEHALFPVLAVAEICRVVRPGGVIAIIDKDRRKQPLSDCQPWERWLGVQEVLDWLRPYCTQRVACPVGHGYPVQHRGLFWCWHGTRRPDRV